MRIKQIFGYSSIYSPLAAVYAFGAYNIGFLAISLIFLAVAGILAVVAIGCHFVYH